MSHRASTSFAAALVPLFVACSATPPASGAPVGTSMDDCPTIPDDATLLSQSGEVALTSVCARDDEGNYYNLSPSDTASAVPLLPAGHLSIVYRFAPGFVPSASRVGATSVDAYVAADILPVFTSDDVVPEACRGAIGFPEDDSSNLVTTTTTLEGDTLVQSLPADAASGEQVDAVLNLLSLFPAGVVFSSGFNVRFYVGSVPCVGAPDGGVAPLLGGS